MWYSLRDAIVARDFGAAAQIFDGHPVLRGARNEIGETILHHLAVENDHVGVAWLRSRGCDLDVKNEFGVPVVFEVALLGYRELLEQMVKDGVDLKTRDAECQDIYAYLREYRKIQMIAVVKEQTAQPGATDNPDDAHRI